uniref:Gem-associated protein 6 Sm-like domain-containing protein n=1 Tax=Oreochromis niloticus TaxID=8128 RepID=A0A669EJB5_ORENI
MQCGWPLMGPLRWLHYVNKEVKVRAGKGEEHRGWLLSVDPVSARSCVSGEMPCGSGCRRTGSPWRRRGGAESGGRPDDCCAL